MRVEVISKNVEVTPAIRSMVEKKSSKIKLFVPEPKVLGEAIGRR